MWSIAEYVDHVREVLFGMRFVLDTAVGQPGTDLGEPPEPRFDPEPRAIDIGVALSGIDREASALRDRLAELPDSAWNSKVTAGGDAIDARWIARHAVHDATHHLLDVDRLREAL
jgi:DinB superfamily